MNKKNRIALILTIVLIVVCIGVIAVIALNNKGNDQPAINQETEGKKTQAATEPAETEPPEIDNTPEFVNPLTGLEADKDFSGLRPVGIMINNIAEAIPQEGISKADIVYECLAEGGITRMFMLFQDYPSLGQTGSIRSSRPYYLDFAQSHDAIYFHAGGSDDAYDQMVQRKIDHFDGVRGPGGYFYRDQWRLNNMAYEHTMVITGEAIVRAITNGKTRTTIRDNFENPMQFVKYDTVDKLEKGQEAKNIYLPFSTYQRPYMTYDETTETYKRFQYNKPQVDKQFDNQQLEFTNILVIFVPESPCNDAKHHINVDTTGTGEGFYITEGKAIDIKWSKKTIDSEIKFTNTDGSQLLLNRGKTYIAYMDKNDKALVEFNH